MKECIVEGLNDFLNAADTLPTPPQIALRIIEAAKRETASMEEFTRLVSSDPALSVKILSVANSPLYMPADKVESIERAVRVLGLEAVKNIALSFVLVRGLKREKIDWFDHDLFWRRSITAATGAEILSRRLNIKREDVFVTPLLMDIGILVMYLVRPDDYQRVLMMKNTMRMTTCEAEMEVFGFDHQELGGVILKEWSIPEDIYLPVHHHHDLNKTPPEIREFVDVLVLADMMSAVYNGNRSTETYTELKGLLSAKFKMDEIQADEILDEVALKTLDILEIFEVSPGDIKPYSSILQEANEELGRLNLTYEQLLMELRQEKKRAEDLAAELKEANERLRELIFQDELTGLNNRRYFEDYLEREMRRSERYTHSLAVILADIDRFGKVNEAFGYAGGDSVLRKVGHALVSSIRDTDFAARHGGEEFVFVLPESDVHKATFFAERIRKLIEGMVIMIDGEPVRLTVSLGVTIYNPVRNSKSREEIMQAARKALAGAKKSGGNRLSVAI